MKHRKHDLAIFHMLSEQEVEFEFDRAVRFMDMESNFSIVTEPALIRKDYQREIKSYMKRIQEGCREYHVDYRKIFIETPYDKILTEFLLERSR
jgi:hypothetical protein